LKKGWIKTDDGARKQRAAENSWLRRNCSQEKHDPLLKKGDATGMMRKMHVQDQAVSGQAGLEQRGL
jgi:hypothetical protein